MLINSLIAVLKNVKSDTHNHFDQVSTVRSINLRDFDGPMCINATEPFSSVITFSKINEKLIQAIKTMIVNRLSSNSRCTIVCNLVIIVIGIKRSLLTVAC